MSDITLTEGNDNYTQPEPEKDNWNNYFGLGGNDIIRLYNGTVVGGPGNDTIERIPVPGQSWRTVGVAYWNSPAGVQVDLQAGTAADGYGTQDTLIGVDVVHGNSRDDWVNGNANENFFWGNGGNDIFIGGAGVDTVGVNGFSPTGGGPWRAPRLDELEILVSVDGRNATIRPIAGVGTGFSYTLTDVEKFQYEASPGNWVTRLLTDFITPLSMAQQAIAAGSDWRWNIGQALGSTATVSFSFITQAPASGVGAIGFRSFTASEQQLVREIFLLTTELTGISFSEVADTGNGGQIRLGVSQQVDSKGVSWLPNLAGSGALAGDVWMDIESMIGITPGTEGYAALLHEIGHALGLRHPTNADAGDTWAIQLRAQDDRTNLSVMSTEESADGLFRSAWGPLDVLALRYLYGSKSVSTGDTIYVLGSEQTFAQTTITDDGGMDSIDASVYAIGSQLNLNPGTLSSVGMTTFGVAAVDNLAITAGSWIENVIGTAFDDVLLGNTLGNRMTGGLGNDWIDGGSGVDTAVFADKLENYLLSYNFGKVFVEARNGVSGFDTLIDIENLTFSDRSVLGDTLTYSGSLVAGKTLSVVNILTNVSDPGAVLYQWKENGVDIAGATAQSFQLTSAQIGKAITLSATFQNLSGVTMTVVSNSIGAVSSPAGVSFDLTAYSWKNHILLSGVSVSAIGSEGGSYTGSSTVSGVARLTEVSDLSLNLTAQLVANSGEAAASASAVNLQDAIAILKMIVGLPVNASNQPISPYQSLAADFDGNGSVGLNDAIAVLKHVVGLSAPSPQWRFLNDTDTTVASKIGLNPGIPGAMASIDVAAATTGRGLVGYLGGDVDGSYAGLPEALDLDVVNPSYFTLLVANTPGIQLSQFGIYIS